MWFKDTVGIVSILISAAGYAIYIRSIFKSHTRPHAFSWIVWALLTAITFLAQVSKGAGPGAWATGFTSILCVSVAILGVLRGERDIKRSDTIAFVAALTAIPLWQITHNPLSAVIIAALVEVFAFYPTIRKSYKKPHEELALLYTLDVLKYLLSALAMDHYSLTTVLYPAAVFVTNGSFVLMLLWRRHKLKI